MADTNPPRATGEVAARVSRSLASNVLVQTSAATLFGSELQSTDWIDVNVTNGRAIVYGSSVDNITQDPSFTLAQPVQ